MSALQYVAWSVFALVVVYAIASGCGLVTVTRKPRPRHRRDWRSEAGDAAVGLLLAVAFGFAFYTVTIVALVAAVRSLR